MIGVTIRFYNEQYTIPICNNAQHIKHKTFTYTTNNISIAFKPAESGWGSGTKYSQNYDSIFSKKIKTEDRDKKLTKSTNDSK